MAKGRISVFEKFGVEESLAARCRQYPTGDIPVFEQDLRTQATGITSILEFAGRGMSLVGSDGEVFATIQLTHSEPFPFNVTEKAEDTAVPSAEDTAEDTAEDPKTSKGKTRGKK